LEEQQIGLMNERTVIAAHGRHSHTPDPGLSLTALLRSA